MIFFSSCHFLCKNVNETTWVAMAAHPTGVFLAKVTYFSKWSNADIFLKSVAAYFTIEAALYYTAVHFQKCDIMNIK